MRDVAWQFEDSSPETEPKRHRLDQRASYESMSGWFQSSVKAASRCRRSAACCSSIPRSAKSTAVDARKVTITWASPPSGGGSSNSTCPLRNTPLIDFNIAEFSHRNLESFASASTTNEANDTPPTLHFATTDLNGSLIGTPLIFAKLHPGKAHCYYESAEDGKFRTQWRFQLR